MIRLHSIRVLSILSLAWQPSMAQGGASGPGPLLPKPGGEGSFFQDRHRGGNAHELRLEELVWGRLVDVHGLDAHGSIDPEPVFRDFLVGAAIQSDGADYLLVPSRATQLERLVVLRPRGTRDFAELAHAAERAAVVIPARAFDAPIVATVPRNAALGLRFSDLLEDGSAAAGALSENVRVTLGDPPTVPFPARVLFDAHHGGIARGGFHSTRVLVDPAVTEFEAGELAAPLPIQPTGLPASANGASFLLRLPARTDPGAGQFTLLTNLSGRALSTSANAPFDPASPTLDVVRAARAANDEDPNSGFLLDLRAPEVLGALPVSLTQAVSDPAGTSGFAFLVDWTFTTPCADRPLVGDALAVGERTLEVVEQGLAPDGNGAVHGVRMRLAQRTPTAPGALLGNGVWIARLRPGSEASACWFRILPQPASPPAAGVAPEALFAVRFSEPMRERSLDPYDNFRLVRGPAGTQAGALNTVVADLQGASDLANFVLQPVLPLGHSQGTATRYQVELLAGAAGPTDLVGNALESAPSAGVSIAPSAPSETSAGIVLRFASPNEVPGPGADLRGNFFYDLAAGTIRPRPATFFSAAADRSNPVPGIMIPFAPGVQTPLSPFGSKLQSGWRYCDLGWNVRDETKYDVDVVGLDWSPVGGQVINDFYPEFEIRLAHGARLPDEAIDAFLLPRWPNSGLLGAPSLYTDNILEDPRSPQQVVHPRARGYVVNPSDGFLSSTGTPLLPYPLNRGPGPFESYTWRDTSVLAKAGPSGAGVPTDIEAGAPLFLEPTPGTLAPAGAVPSIGLPLLMEFRCYPNDVAVGLNAFAVSLAINSSARPAFRAYSTGGINSMGQVVTKDPDLEDVPSGGLNPHSSPPGQPTQLTAENVFYIGQLDLVTRVSRVHTVWLDAGSVSPRWQPAAVVPASQPPGTSVLIEYRSALGFSEVGNEPFDAAKLDAYGNLIDASDPQPQGRSDWSSLASIGNDRRFLQVRLTLANDVESGTSPELDALALAFRR